MALNNVPLYAVTDSDESDDGAEEEGAQGAGLPPPGVPRRERLERIALFDFLRLVAGNRDPPVGHHTNEALVQSLKANDTINSESLEKAMLACPRDLFVPAPHRGEALMDRPIRVEAAGFNISAPHVQAASLQALAIEPGQRVLDVGCGCGIVTAYAAYLAGSGGDVVGIDIRDSAIRLSAANLQRLREQNIEFTEVAAPIRLERHNVFIPLNRHRGAYDIVHVGGAMPEARLGALLELLGPRGGRIVAPLANDLRLITKSPDGTVRHRVLSQVSFSELEIPRDVEVVQALQKERAEAARRVDVPASTFATDLAHLAGPGANLAALAVAAAAEGSGDGPPEPPAEAAGASAMAVFGPSSPRRGPNGVRPRSQTSLVDAHREPATLAPAHRERPAGEAAGASPSGEAAQAEADAASRPPRPPRAPYWTGGWDRVVAVEAARQDAESGGGSGGGAGGGGGGDGGGAGSMEVSVETGGMDEEKAQGQGGEEEEVQQPAGKPVHIAEVAAAEAPAGPVELAPEPQPVDAAAAAAPGPDARTYPHAYLSDVSSGALALGSPDCQLEGPGWRLPAHKAVLQARCDLLRAHMCSGMRDSDAVSYAVPEAVERVEALEAFLHYIYKDCLPPGGVDSEVMPQLLHAGIYFGCHRLVRLCESLLARELVAASRIAKQRGRRKAAAGPSGAAASGRTGGAGPLGWLSRLSRRRSGEGAPEEGEEEDVKEEEDNAVLAAAVAAAGPLLVLADEGGLDQLRNVAMQFILDHFPAVVVTEGYRQLPRPLVDAVAAEAVARHAELLRQLADLAAQDGDGDDSAGN